MNVDLGIWDKLTRLVICLLVLAALLAVGLWYWPLFRQNEALRKEIYKLDTRIRKEEETGKRLKTSVDALRYDPKAIERLARERLRYSKPDETVILFEAPVSNAPPKL